MLIWLTSAPAVHAQRIRLQQLMMLHGMDEMALIRTMRSMGWRNQGTQWNMPKKPLLFTVAQGRKYLSRLYVFRSRAVPLSKLELVSSAVDSFNRQIRDSLSFYGFQPEMKERAAEEENLRISSSAYFVNRDLEIPVYALILYYREHGEDLVSLTIYQKP